MINHFGQPPQNKEFQSREASAMSDSMKYNEANAEYSSWGLFYSQLYRLKLDFLMSIRSVKLGGQSEAIENFYNCVSDCDDLLTMLVGIVPKSDVEQLDCDIESLEKEFNEYVKTAKLTHRRIPINQIKKLKMIHRTINFLMQRHNLGLPVSQNLGFDVTSSIVGD